MTSIIVAITLTFFLSNLNNKFYRGIDLKFLSIIPILIIFSFTTAIEFKLINNTFLYGELFSHKSIFFCFLLVYVIHLLFSKIDDHLSWLMKYFLLVAIFNSESILIKGVFLEILFLYCSSNKFQNKNLTHSNIVFSSMSLLGLLLIERFQLSSNTEVASVGLAIFFTSILIKLWILGIIKEKKWFSGYVGNFTQASILIIVIANVCGEIFKIVPIGVLLAYFSDVWFVCWSIFGMLLLVKGFSIKKLRTSMHYYFLGGFVCYIAFLSISSQNFEMSMISYVWVLSVVSYLVVDKQVSKLVIGKNKLEFNNQVGLVCTIVCLAFGLNLPIGSAVVFKYPDMIKMIDYNKSLIWIIIYLIMASIIFLNIIVEYKKMLNEAETTTQSFNLISRILVITISLFIFFGGYIYKLM